MVANNISTLTSPFQRLEWESNHFGITAASLGDPALAEHELAAALKQARSDGIQMLVWPTSAERNVSPELLDEFSGLLADRKATFSKPLKTACAEPEPSRDAASDVIAYEHSSASPELVALAIASGAYSRFAIDPHIKRERFEAMYRRWIDRSINRELADAVLIVPLIGRSASACGIAGMITLAESDGMANIGLVAVAEEVRGRGIGSALMRAAEHWMCGRNAREARVVTQLANTPACRLYERSGYTLSKVQHYYHFWP